MAPKPVEVRRHGRGKGALIGVVDPADGELRSAGLVAEPMVKELSDFWIILTRRRRGRLQFRQFQIGRRAEQLRVGMRSAYLRARAKSDAPWLLASGPVSGPPACCIR